MVNVVRSNLNAHAKGLNNDYDPLSVHRRSKDPT